MTRNRPPTPTAPSHPQVPTSEPVARRQALDGIIGEISDEEYLTIFCIEAVETFFDGSGLTTDEDGFIIVAETGAPATPYTYSSNAFKSYDGVSDANLIDYFKPVTEVNEYIPPHEKLHITDLHGFVPGTEGTDHQHPVPNDTITIRQYNGEIGCTLPAVTAWSDLWENAWASYEETFAGNNFVVKSPLTGSKPELTCLRCAFTAPASDWETEHRSDVQELGFGDVHKCPECCARWDTNSISTCENCGVASTAEELDYLGEGLHVESRCPDCGDGPVHERKTRYDT